MDKKYIVGILAVVVIVAAFLLFGANMTGNVIADGTTLGNSEVCDDGDGGVFTGKAGVLTWKTGPSAKDRWKYDACVDDDTIREHYCDSDDGKKDSAVYDCPGACIEEDFESDRVGTYTVARCTN